MNTRDMILICKALSDTKRLEIVQMLSDGEKCEDGGRCWRSQRTG